MGAPIDWSGTNANLPLTGLASLMQGIERGMEIGQKINLSREEMALKEKHLANDAAWRRDMMTQRQPYMEARTAQAQAAADKADRGGGAGARFDITKWDAFLKANPRVAAYLQANAPIAQKLNQQALMGQQPMVPTEAYSYSPPAPAADTSRGLGWLKSIAGMFGKGGEQPAAAGPAWQKFNK